MTWVVRRKQPPDPHLVLLDECLEHICKRMFKEKATRADVATRIRDNKDTQCTVVKTTWNTFCKPEGRQLPIDSVLFELNKTVLEAYVLANLHVIRMCSASLPVPKLDQSFFYGCLSAVSSASRQKQTITNILFRQSVAEYLSWRPQNYRAPDSTHLASGWHQDISLQMVTNTKNSTSTMFYKRFMRYLKAKYMMDGSQAYTMFTAHPGLVAMMVIAIWFSVTDLNCQEAQAQPTWRSTLTWSCLCNLSS